MKHINRTLAALLACSAVSALNATGAIAAAPSLRVTPGTDNPSAKISVSGYHFGASEAVDVYFDSTDVLLVTTNTKGAFAAHKLNVPASALPGEHWITAIGRRDGIAVQKLFTVSTPWAEFGFQAAGKRENSYENVISTANVGQLDTAWTAKLGGTTHYSSPAVANGVVYVGGGSDAKLYAFDAPTGKKLWTATTGGFVFSSPAVAGGKVYVGSLDGDLYAFDATTGSFLWSAHTENFIYSAPTVVNGIVYVGSYDGNLYAFDGTTGATVWTGVLGGADFLSAPAISDGTVYVGALDNKVYAFDATTGAPVWISLDTTASISSSPAVAGGKIFVTNDFEELYYLDQGSGQGVNLLATSCGGSGHSSPAISNGTVFCGGAADGNMWAFPETNGLQIWKTRVTGGGLSSPAVANGVAYFAQNGGSPSAIYALDATAGAYLWSSPISDPVDSSPAVSDGFLYVASNSKLYAFALNGGNNAVYKRHHTVPPAFSTLRPDISLKAMR